MIYGADPSFPSYGRHVPTTAANPECFQTINGWIKQCFDEHTGCQTPYNSQLPTRVLDVGPADGTISPHLYVPPKGTQGQWISLSHRWGDQKFLTTTTKNLNEHEVSIPMHALSKTFQDAVLLTRKLGFQYLWIDSLCILQDSKADWEAESLKMRDVYRYSTLNLAAGHPLSPEYGILADRTPVLHDTNSFLFPSLEGVELGFVGETGIRTKVKVQHFPQEVATHAQRGMNLLTPRGWVLQESVLSPRTITWTEEQMTWQCTSHWAEEFDTRSFNLDKSVWRAPLLGKKILRLSEPNMSTATIYHAWRLVLRAYMRCALTVPTDVLTAISGLAQEIYAHTGDTFCAGLWLNDFHHGLLWSLGKLVDVEQQPPKNPSGPSWSWISFRWTCQLYDHIAVLQKVELSVVSIDGVRTNDNQLPRIEATAATVSAPMIASPVGYGAASPCKDRLDPFQSNGWLLDDASGKKCWLQYTFDTGRCFPQGEMQRGLFTGEVWCLAVGLTARKRVGLLLRHSAVRSGAYERLGLFEMDIAWAGQLGAWDRREIVLV